jgi:hypothetical protein
MRGGRPVRVTSEAIEKNIHNQRDAEQQRRELTALRKENANLMSVAGAQSRIEQQRRLNQQQICRNEREYDEKLKQQQFDAKFRELTIMQNQALSNELNKDSVDEERKRREVQKICEEAPELRELDRMLKIAYLNKERAVQYEEKILLALKEQERIQAIEDEIETERIRSLRAESNKDYEKRLMYQQQRAALQDQINEKRARLAEARAQIEYEKTMVDDIVNKINQEDENDYRMRKEKQVATAKMVREFEIQRQQELEAARKAAKAEEARINAYNQAIEARSEGIAAKKQAKRDEEDRILATIVEENERKRRGEEEFNHLRDMLWEEELEAKRSHEVYERQLKQTRMKEDMIRANDEMMKFKELRRLQEAEREARLVTLMRQKFAEDEARERADEEQRQAAKMHHMTLIEKQKDERNSLYQQERVAEQMAIQEANEREEYRKRVIQEARRRLLEEHASRLQGYLPNKVFESKEEYEEFKQR